jgi:hypothetical protein
MAHGMGILKYLMENNGYQISNMRNLRQGLGIADPMTLSLFPSPFFLFTFY